MIKIIVYILLVLYIVGSVYNGYIMSKGIDNVLSRIVWSVMTFGVSLLFTPIIIYALLGYGKDHHLNL